MARSDWLEREFERFRKRQAAIPVHLRGKMLVVTRPPVSKANEPATNSGEALRATHAKWADVKQRRAENDAPPGVPSEADVVALVAEVERLQELNARQAAHIEELRKPVQEHCSTYHIPAIAERDEALARIRAVEEVCTAAENPMWWATSRNFDGSRSPAQVSVADIRAALGDK